MNIKYYINKPYELINRIGRNTFFKLMSDERYLKMRFKQKTGRVLNLDAPVTFNEKIQWLKLYDRKPIYTTMVDKYEVKKYVADKLGGGYVIPTLGVWDRFEEIDFDALPNQFVLKCTHDSGGIVICRDKQKLDKKKAKKILSKSLKQNYFWHGREWPYKNVKPRILAEQYMQDGVSSDLPVYKFFCFGGEPKIIQVIQNDKQKNESIDYFDAEWKLLDLRQNFPNSEIPLNKPKNFEKMLGFAKELSKEKKSFLRVDLYEINGKIYFSEFTFFSDGGMATFNPPKWDEILGEWITLPGQSLN